MQKIFCLLTIIFSLALTGFASSVLAEEKAGQCWSGKDARKLFNENKLVKQSNYYENTGARVQREHPNTYMFGQAKHGVTTKLNAKTKSPMDFGLCSYSNHVGMVFMILIRGGTIAKKPCVEGECLQQPHWRSEWIEGNAEQDRPGQTHMDVCVVRRQGIDYPSPECPIYYPSGE